MSPQKSFYVFHEVDSGHKYEDFRILQLAYFDRFVQGCECIIIMQYIPFFIDKFGRNTYVIKQHVKITKK